ncbi:MAG: SatD family protein [Bacilli bacterium]|nr:SatD family protein [Bacilli bacterium]
MINKEVFVITADVIKSKSYKDIESILKGKLEIVNKSFQYDLLTKFTSLKGDEFQAILEKDNYEKVLPIIRSLKHHMGKCKLRIGIGYGMINEDPKTDSEYGSWEYNGEAFFKARDAIDELNIKKKNSVQMITMFNMFQDQTYNDIVNLLYYNVDKAIAKWDDEIWEIIGYLENEFTHEEISLKMNVKNQKANKRNSYTKKINRSNWYLVDELEKLITRFVKEKLI